MTNTEPEDDVTTLRRAAELLRGFEDTGVKELALAHNFDNYATYLELGRPVLRLDLVMPVARAVVAFGGAR